MISPSSLKERGHPKEGTNLEMVGGREGVSNFSENVLPGAAWTAHWTQRRSLGDWVTEGGKVEYPNLILYESEC